MIGVLAYILVGVGGGIGAILRFVLQGKLGALTLAGGFPAGILTANLIGSLLMGIFIGIIAKINNGNLLGETTRLGLYLFFATGLLGGFTTFSSFALDAYSLIERHEIIPAIIYVVLSTAGSITLVFLGIYVLKSI